MVETTKDNRAATIRRTFFFEFDGEQPQSFTFLMYFDDTVHLVTKQEWRDRSCELAIFLNQKRWEFGRHLVETAYNDQLYFVSLRSDNIALDDRTTVVEQWHQFFVGEGIQCGPVYEVPVPKPEPTISEIRRALQQPFLTVFLEGQDENGSNVYPVAGDRVGGVEHIERDLLDQETGFATQIFSDASALGYYAPACVVTVWRHNAAEHERDYPCGNGYDDRTGITYGAHIIETSPPWWEYVRVDPVLTELFCGTAAEQAAEMERPDDV